MNKHEAIGGQRWFVQAQRGVVIGAILATGVVACSSEGALIGDEEEQATAVQPLVGQEWLGWQLGVSPGKWRELGELRMAPPGSRPPPMRPAEARPTSTPTQGRGMVLLDPETRKRYQIEMDDADLAEISQALRAAGVMEPTHGGGEGVDDEMVSKGWSLGTDNRVDRGISRYRVAYWPLETMGPLKNPGSVDSTNGYCTGTFVSAAGTANFRYVLTAAHCLFDAAGNYIAPDFTPRNDSCRSRTNEAVANCDQSPYGKWISLQAALLPAYDQSCRADEGERVSWACYSNDIAIVKVQRVIGGSFPGAMGLGYFSEADLAGNNKYHRGYPNCGGAGDPRSVPPVVCLNRTLYGDSALSLSVNDPQPDGFAHYYWSSSDVSPGHGGGPLYVNFGGGQYAFAVQTSAASCIGSECTMLRPNVARAIDPEWYAVMAYFLSL